MVEKVSESSASVAMNIDTGSDDRALLAWIDKKKKHSRQGGDSLPTLVMSPEMLIKLINSPAQGGGFSTSETTARQTVALPLAQNVHSPGMEKSDALRQQVLHAVDSSSLAPAMAQKMAPQVGKKAVEVGRQETSTTMAEPLSVATTSAKTPSAMAAQPLPRPVSTASLMKEASAEHTLAELAVAASRTLPREESQEVRPQLSGVKPHESLSPMQNETPTQNKTASTTLQQLKMQASTAQNAVKADAGPQTLEVSYAFQRWSGEHSVKVSLPTQALREGAITLLPSDTRVADALSRNLGHLPGLAPELLQPQRERERDEQQQRRQQQQDEEQE